MSFLKKLLVFILLLFVVTQLLVPHLVPSAFVYNDRVVYDVFKDNVFTIETTIKSIKSTIEREHLKDYVIILGDSVGYSTPCPPENSIARYMNDIALREGKSMKAFNLSVPSMMTGDIYVMIRLLEKYGVSAQNLIINFCYWEFRINTPVFWLKDYLKDIDPESYKLTLEGKNTKKSSVWGDFEYELKHFTDTNIALLEYREFVTYRMKADANASFGEKPAVVKPWFEKSYLPAEMKKDSNSWMFTDQPFYMDESNPQVYFLDKIISLQQGRNTVFFLAAMNDKLLSEATSKPGYIANMKRIDDYFAGKNVKFINYNKKIDYNLFSDHVHLIQQGYKTLAEDLWIRINN